MRRWWRSFRYQPVRGLALGTSSCRYLTSLNPVVGTEPSIVYRYKDDKRLVAKGQSIGDARPCCRLSGQTESFQPFEDDKEITPRILECFLAHFGRQAAYRDSCLFPKRLMLTAAPDLLDRIRPMMADAAAAAGFRTWKVVPEIDCLARLPSIRERSPVVVADIGHTATRFYSFEEADDPGVAHGERGPGGLAMQHAVVDALRERHNLMIGVRTARDVLEQATEHPVDRQDWRGRSCETGLPAKVNLDASEIREYILPTCRQIGVAFAPVLGRMSCPGKPRIHLAGGGAEAPGLSDLLAAQLAVPVSVSDDPALDVARGVGTCLETWRFSNEADRNCRLGKAPPQTG